MTDIRRRVRPQQVTLSPGTTEEALASPLAQQQSHSAGFQVETTRRIDLECFGEPFHMNLTKPGLGGELL
jgi:hypothetical protein